MLHILAVEGPNGRFLPSDIKEFWWSTIAFSIVMALLIWKALPIVKAGLSGRSERIQEEIVASERARVEAEAELSSLRSKLGNADAEAQRITEEARSTAETVRADLIARADADAIDVRAKANVELAASTGAASADIQAEVAEQATRATESVVKSNLDDKTYADLIDRYIDQVGGS